MLGSITATRPCLRRRAPLLWPILMVKLQPMPFTKSPWPSGFCRPCPQRDIPGGASAPACPQPASILPVPKVSEPLRMLQTKDCLLKRQGRSKRHEQKTILTASRRINRNPPARRQERSRFPAYNLGSAPAADIIHSGECPHLEVSFLPGNC